MSTTNLNKPGNEQVMIRRNKFDDYYLGLDIGTDSIGWCVTDPDYHILKFHEKAMWGIRLFDEATTAAERRAFRTSRRRLHRRRQRIALVEELLSQEIARVDPVFFLRLRESRFLEEDKNEKVRMPYTLFADSGYTDVQFHRDYPTIYHLRYSLMTGEKKADIRLYYLAISHLMKHRGHFLFVGDIRQATSFDTVFSELKDYAADQLEVAFETASLKEVEETLLDRKTGRLDKKKKLYELFHAKDSVLKEALAAICGSSVSLDKLFNTEEFKEAEISKISFSDGIDENKAELLASELGDRYEYILRLKALYDWSVLSQIMAGSSSISEAQVKLYEKHRKDLYDLKTIIRKYLPEKYKELFTDNSNPNGYAAYSGHASSGRVLEVKKAEQKDFCDYIKKMVSEIQAEDPILNRIKSETENYTFLPKQVSKSNSSIPNQVHLRDLEIIVEKLGRDYPIFTQKDEDGFSVCDKIIRIFTFRIPYYVGPINTYHSNKGGNSWAVRKESGRVLPWLFDKKIDEKASAERFIRRLTNKCTYLMGEDVLPKDSLLYSKYMVLNELNNVRVNGCRLEVPVKQRIYEEIFKTRKGKLTLKKLKEWMQKENILGADDQMSGVDDVFQSSLKSYQDFKRIIGSRVDTMPMMVEDIIRNIVIFGDDRRLLTERIKERYGDSLSDDEVHALTKLSYTGWGRFSERFLNGIEDLNRETGELQTIIMMMWNSQNNLMELLSTKYSFLDSIKEHNELSGGHGGQLSYDLVQESYASPAVKRAIWQTLLIVDEISKVTGKRPSRIFLETARGKEDNPSRKKSRKSQLLDLYKAIKSEEKDWISEINSREEREFQSKKLFLYYTQMGRDMYSGREIDLNALFTNDYDIDHIIPQSKTKDDSILNNLVLVRTEENKEKGDTYPIPSKLRKPELWKLLRDRELITKEKYERLLRKEALSEEELASFINRQLVETRQSTKVVAQILGQVMPESRIVYSRAGLVSDFRKEYSFYKSRAINDYHHAKDAYLNIVVGNVYYTKFTDNPLRFIKEELQKGKEKAQYNLRKMYSHSVTRGNRVAWVPGDDGTISTVRKYMAKNSILFTRYATEKRGELFKQMPQKKDAGQLFPLKTSDERYDVRKYGGYNKPAINYYMLVESDGKKGRIRTLEGVPVYLSDNQDKIEAFCRDENGLNLKNPIILIPKIRINSLIKLDGYPMHISGKTGDRIAAKNAVQLCVSQEEEKILHTIEKVAERIKDNKQYRLDEHDGLGRDDFERIYNLLRMKAGNNIYKNRPASQKDNLEKWKEVFLQLSPEEQCTCIMEILHLFQCRFQSADLRSIGGTGQSGVFTVSKQLSKYRSAYLVNQSITGLFETKTDLLG